MPASAGPSTSEPLSRRERRVVPRRSCIAQGTDNFREGHGIGETFHGVVVHFGQAGGNRTFRIHPAAKTQGDVWVWGREIAAVGRKYNGLADPNFIAFHLRSLCRRGGRRTGWALFPWADRVVTRLIARIYGAHTFMMT